MKIKIHDHGFVRLDAACADDLSVVNSAKVSFNKRHDEIQEGDAGLISYLLRNKHGTPFEHNFFRFHVKAPIFVFREWHRHRIGVSINEWSARYSKLKGEFYIPQKLRTQVGKPGNYKFEEVTDKKLVKGFQSILLKESQEAFRHYEDALASGIAKEQARLFIPVNTYSEMYWSCNARSLMNFLALRNHPTAQEEIRDYAIALEKIFEQHMPITAKEFQKERIAP